MPRRLLKLSGKKYSGKSLVDGVPQPASLFKMVKDTIQGRAAPCPLPSQFSRGAQIEVAKSRVIDGRIAILGVCVSDLTV